MRKWEKFSKEELEQFVKDSYSFAELARKCGYSEFGGSYLQNMKDMVAKYQFDISHFKGEGWNKGNFDYTRFKYGSIIKVNSAIPALVALRSRKCEVCNNSIWQGRDIPLEIHHLNGDRLDNTLENLQLICPNCHALTDTYCGRNIHGNSRTDCVTEEAYVDALRSSPNIRQALIKLGLTPKGGNYSRANELIVKYQITHLLEH